MVKRRGLVRAEKVLIDKITDRVVKENSGGYDKAELTAYIVTWHTKVSRLALERLLTSRTADFNHDVYGIISHLNRDMSYTNMSIHFVPRCG